MIEDNSNNDFSFANIAETGNTTPSNLNTSEFAYYIGSAPDVDLNSPDIHDKIFYHPERFLQGHVQYVSQLATEKSSAMRLSGIGFKAILIDPSNQRVVSAVPLRSLLSAGRIPLAYKNMQVAPVSAKEAASIIEAAVETYSTESILWRLALCASRGRLPANTSLDRPISLAYWPNLTRLQAPPHAARILSLWARDSYSIKETVEALNVPQRYIFALYSACSAIGLIQAGQKKTRPSATMPPAAQAQAKQKRGIFRLLLNKLSGY